MATVIGAVAIVSAGAGFALDRLTMRRDFYAAYDERFNSFLSLCMSNPEIAGLLPPNEERRIQETAAALGIDERVVRHRWLLMSYLLSTLEATHWMMTMGPRTIREQFAPSWEDYIRDWSSDPVFAAVYETTGGDYGGRFSAWLEEIIGAPGGKSYPSAGERQQRPSRARERKKRDGR